MDRHWEIQHLGSSWSAVLETADIKTEYMLQDNANCNFTLLISSVYPFTKDQSQPKEDDKNLNATSGELTKHTLTGKKGSWVGVRTA